MGWRGPFNPSGKASLTRQNHHGMVAPPTQENLGEGLTHQNRGIRIGRAAPPIWAGEPYAPEPSRNGGAPIQENLGGVLPTKFAA